MTTIAWVVSFEQVGAQLSCMAYAVDLNAFKPKVAATLKQVIPSAMKTSRKQWGPNWRLGLFWHALKERLQRDGISWQTPTELNPEIAW